MLNAGEDIRSSCAPGALWAGAMVAKLIAQVIRAAIPIANTSLADVTHLWWFMRVLLVEREPTIPHRDLGPQNQARKFPGRHELVTRRCGLARGADHRICHTSRARDQNAAKTSNFDKTEQVTQIPIAICLPVCIADAVRRVQRAQFTTRAALSPNYVRYRRGQQTPGHPKTVRRSSSARRSRSLDLGG